MPFIEVGSPNELLHGAGLSELAAVLRDFISSRRWFRAKTRTIRDVHVEDVLPTAQARSYFLVTRIDYAQGESDRYVMDISVGLVRFGDDDPGDRPETNGEVIATYRTGDGGQGNIYSALSEKSFRDALLASILCGESFSGAEGELLATRMAGRAEDRQLARGNLASSISRAEQSNTSIVYGDRFILKLFRKIEVGINPDLEIGAFLTARGFLHTPAVLGQLEYRKADGTAYAMGILQQFVCNQGDAWKYTLESLGSFFDRALKRGDYAPELPIRHPMDVSAFGVAAPVEDLIGDYADSARLLGKRTAEMHAALADPAGGADFVPEPFTAADGQCLSDEMIGQADIAFELLRRKQASLADTAAADARLLLRMEQRVAGRFAEIRERPISGLRMRFHGDYHLGQVLYTGSDFMIIDFEGEPARPLSERRAKTLAMRDVAGMIRSFQYAAYAALFGQVPGVPAHSEMRGTVESWAAWWAMWISGIYLMGYFEAAERHAFMPRDLSERRLLLDAFLLQKALYEVAYELNNRPDWVRIPLRGILSLVA